MRDLPGLEAHIAVVGHYSGSAWGGSTTYILCSYGEEFTSNEAYDQHRLEIMGLK